VTAMNPKNKIKIIKRALRTGETSATAVRSQKSESLQHSTRKAVTAWVKEFKQRRVADPRQAFARLFGEPASPLNSLSQVVRQN
jgi:hypothetical protein